MSDDRFARERKQVHQDGKVAFLDRMHYPETPEHRGTHFCVMRMTVLGEEASYSVFFFEPVNQIKAKDALRQFPVATKALNGLQMTAGAHSFVLPSEYGPVLRPNPMNTWHLQVDNAGDSDLEVGDIVAAKNLADQEPLRTSMAQFADHPGRQYWRWQAESAAAASGFKC